MWEREGGGARGCTHRRGTQKVGDDLKVKEREGVWFGWEKESEEEGGRRCIIQEMHSE